jgi:DNA replication protein DnaC
MNEEPNPIAEVIERRFASMIEGPSILCHQCGGPAKRVTFCGKPFTLCDSCFEEERNQHEVLDQRARRLAAWDAQCPDGFRTQIDPKRLHPALVPALDMSGFDGGVALVGEAGSGKTRVAWQLLRRAAAAGRSVYAISHAAFRAASSAQHDRDRMVADLARETISRAHKAQVLLIDDIGKGAPTETADEAFFELLTVRRDNSMVTHWTANAGSAWLQARFGKDKGPPIILRLRDLTEGRVFNTTTKEEPK